MQMLRQLFPEHYLGIPMLLMNGTNRMLFILLKSNFEVVLQTRVLYNIETISPL